MSNTKKIRILYTIPNFNTAGSGKVVYDLVQNLDKSRFETEIACGSDDGKFFKIVKDTGVPIHIFRTKTDYRPYYNLMFRILKISKFYKDNNYDIIHSWQWSNDWTEGLAARIVGKKWLFTKKAMGFGNNHWKIKSLLANFIVTVNDQMSAYFPNKKAQKLIPFGLDTEYYRRMNNRNPNRQDSEVFHIITIANLVPVKKVEVIIKAIHRLKGSNVKLSILGSNTNDYGQEMIALSKSLDLENEIEFLGKRTDIRSLYSEADLYVISSEREGMPMALVEAMSMGTPVLGAQSPGISYVLRDFQDLLYPFGDDATLAKKIQEIRHMKKKDRQQLGQDLRRYCIDHYTLNAFIKAHEDLYLMLAGKQR